ncbi:DNA mismatch repair protein MutS [termite gut metagenome]|uniref:DNA mismatch repair protein MutS n=1 Tax=termite gut metagenome TaxID=433724 RepID=A0A5J4SET1_9ZZZZ
METPGEIVSLYRQIISETQQELNKVSRRIHHVGTIRLILFVAGVARIIYFRNESSIVIAAIAAATFIPFLILIKRHNRLFYRKDYLEKRLK